MNGPTLFDLSSVFSAVAGAVPDQDMLVWRERRLTYGEVDRRIDALAAYLRTVGLGCHTERKQLARHESGQDHLGIYLRNGTEYLEAMIAGYRGRVAPFNVSFRYVEDELTFLLADADARAVVYHAEFAPRIAAIRAHLPRLQVLVPRWTISWFWRARLNSSAVGDRPVSANGCPYRGPGCGIGTPLAMARLTIKIRPPYPPLSCPLIPLIARSALLKRMTAASRRHATVLAMRPTGA